VTGEEEEEDEEDAGAGGARTEDPTPRRLAEARRRGQVAQSPDLRGAIALAATVLALVALAPSMLGQLTRFLGTALSRAASGASFSGAPLPGGADAALVRAARLGFETAATLLAVPLATAFALTWVAGLLQTGGLWVSAPLRPDLGRLSPLAGRRRLWGRQSAGAAGWGIIKVVILAAVAAGTLGPLVPDLVRLTGASAGRALTGFAVMAQELAIRMAVAAVLIGVAAYLRARTRHARALRMTRRQVERDRREVEGHPLHRAERQRRYREAGAGDALVEIGRSTVVITGGGAEAPVVALAYQPGDGHAPIVVASGARRAGQHIIQVARAARVPVVADDDLARDLRRLSDGAEIPARCYDRVAEILRATQGNGLASLAPPVAMTHGASGRRA
jgi:flagellar biosynthesis protein FlhB